MINYFLKFYIKKRAKELNLPFPTNWKQNLYEYKKIERIINKYIIFTDYGYTPKTLNGGSMIPYVINLTKEWAVHIVLYNSQETKNAFLITLGHELAHKEKELSRLRLNKINRKFIAQINEVHADFGAVQKMFDCDRNTLLNAIDYKLKYKKEHLQGDIEDYSHPSWARRRYYAKNFDFDSKLIRQIAKDVGCSNSKLVDKVVNFYDEIKLRPEIK